VESVNPDDRKHPMAAVLPKAFRVLCFAYWAALTVLLLVPDPSGVLGVQPPGLLGGRGIHLAAFAGLGFLAAAARWPVGGRALAAVLLGYAVAAELLQYFVPPRTVQLEDLAENFLGLAIGAAVFALGRRWLPRQSARRPAEASCHTAAGAGGEEAAP
jgi:hypothetical protein